MLQDFVGLAFSGKVVVNLWTIIGAGVLFGLFRLVFLYFKAKLR